MAGRPDGGRDRVDIGVEVDARSDVPATAGPALSFSPDAVA
jgi:hypothetical protein